MNNGQRLAWLDSLANIGNSETMRFRLCIAVGTSNSPREGWFIDNVTWQNDGDQPGAWFHGNLTGDYAPNADGTLVMPINFSGLANPIELEIRSDWDIEGGSNDGMTIWYSMDQGITWVLLSPLPGLPGNGVVHQGVIYNDESFGWLPMFYPVPLRLQHMRMHRLHCSSSMFKPMPSSTMEAELLPTVGKAS